MQVRERLPKEPYVITISRQMGSYGQIIAEAAAYKLGYRLVWRELINAAAHRIGKPEVALAAIDELGLLGICPSRQDCLDFQQAVYEVIHELAEEGNVVIVGRASQAILHGNPRTIHIRIIAPVKVRAKRIARTHNLTMRDALKQVRASDRYRRRYLKRHYKVRWNDPELYDLVINTARVNPQTAARLIYDTLQGRLAHPAHAGPSPQETTLEPLRPTSESSIRSP
jgi:cytidylate kinase